MPRRKSARVYSSEDDEDFIVTSEEESTEQNETSSSEEEAILTKRPQRRNSTRTPASAAQERTAAKTQALQRIQTARKRTATRKRRAQEPTSDLDDTEDEQDPNLKDHIEDSSDAPSPAPKRRTRLQNFRSRGSKPSQLVTGHRDYASDRSGGSESLSDFIASEESEPESEGATSKDNDSEEVIEELDDEEEEERPARASRKDGKGVTRKSGSKSKGKGTSIAQEKSGKRGVKTNNAAAKYKDLEKKAKEEKVGLLEEEEEEEEDGFFEASVPSSSRVLKKRRAGPALLITSSSDEEEDDDAVLAAAASGIAAAENAPKRRRLRKGKETTPIKEENKKPSTNAAGIAAPGDDLEDKHSEEDTSGGHLVTAPSLGRRKKEAEDEKKKDASPAMGLRKRPERPKLTALERIAMAQSQFKSQPAAEVPPEDVEVSLLTDEGEPSSESGEESKSIGEEESDDDVGDSQGEEREEGALRKAYRSPGWQRAVEVLGIGQRKEKECFFDYIEYLTMCYIDPTYRARINASAEHKMHFQTSVRRIETKMTTARDAVHSEAWRSCSRGLLEAVEWLPAAESGWDPHNPTTDSEEGWERWTERCDACNRKKSHATRLIVFKGRPRPPPEDESWEDLPANRRLSVSFLEVSPVYKKNRQRRIGGGRRGFQLGFGDDDFDALFSTRELGTAGSGEESEEDDPLMRYIRGHQERVEGGDGDAAQEESNEEGEHGDDGAGPSRRSRRVVVVESEEEESEEESDDDDDGPKADVPFDPDEGPSGEFIRKDFRVGRHCSARLMLYHGLFHWKHRLLARLKKELKAELRRRKRTGESIDPGAVADGLLSRETLKANLWNNFKTLLSLAETYQLAGGEGNAAWRNGPDPHTQLIEALAELHASSDGDESSVAWGEEEEEEEDLSEVEEEEQRTHSNRNKDQSAAPRNAAVFSTPQKSTSPGNVVGSGFRDHDGAGPSSLGVEDGNGEGGTPEGAARSSMIPGLENPTPESAANRRLSSSGLKQVDIRNFFGGTRGAERDDGVKRRL